MMSYKDLPGFEPPTSWSNTWCVRPQDHCALPLQRNLYSGTKHFHLFSQRPFQIGDYIIVLWRPYLGKHKHNDAKKCGGKDSSAENLLTKNSTCGRRVRVCCYCGTPCNFLFLFTQVQLFYLRFIFKIKDFFLSNGFEAGKSNQDFKRNSKIRSIHKERERERERE